MNDGKFTTLRGRRVLIIGGTSGIGFSTAEALVDAGAKVSVCSSRTSRVTKAVEKLQSQLDQRKTDGEDIVTGHTCDLGQSNGLEDNIESLLEAVPGPIDHIIYTAVGPIAPCPVSAMTIQNMEQEGCIRFFGPMLVAKHAVSRLTDKSTTCSLTFTSGVSANRPVPEIGPMVSSYCAAMEGAVRSLAVELQPIRVNAVSPGPVNTELWDPFPSEFKSAAFDSMKTRHLTGRVAAPRNVAQAYLYCLLDEDCTGSVLQTNSGSPLV